MECMRLRVPCGEGHTVVDAVDRHVRSVPAVPHSVHQDECVRTMGEAARVRVRLEVGQRPRGDRDAIDLDADLVRPSLCRQRHRIEAAARAAWRRRWRRRGRWRRGWRRQGRRRRRRWRRRRWADVERVRLRVPSSEGRAVVEAVDRHVRSVPAVPHRVHQDECVRTRGEAARVRVRLVVGQRSRGDCDAINLDADLIRPCLCRQRHTIKAPARAAWGRRRRRRGRRRGRGRRQGRRRRRRRRRWADMERVRLRVPSGEAHAVVDAVDRHVRSVPAVPH